MGRDAFLCGCPQIGCGSGAALTLAVIACLPFAFADIMEGIVEGGAGGGDGSECATMPKGFLNEEEEEVEGTAGCGVDVDMTLVSLVHLLVTPGVGVEGTAAADIHGLGVGATGGGGGGSISLELGLHVCIGSSVGLTSPNNPNFAMVC